MKVRSAIFSLFICLLLMSPAGLLILQEGFKADLPDWLTAQSAKPLSGGWTDVDLSKSLHISKVLNGDFQESCSSFIEQFIPCKAHALLLNAGLQREAIHASNMLMKYEAYPTYYGSNNVYIPSADALGIMPMRGLKNTTKGMRKFAKKLKSFAEAYPDKTFTVILPDVSATSDSNPASKLVTGRVSTQNCIDALNGIFEETDNVSAVSFLYRNTDDYYKGFFKTDHHWNGYGALDMMKELFPSDRSITSPDNREIKISDISVNGSFARTGLDLLNQKPVLPIFDFKGFRMNTETRPPVMQAYYGDFNEESIKGAGFNFYATFYGTTEFAQEFPITNTEQSAKKGDAILLNDSFGDCFHWALAQEFAHLASFGDMHHDLKGVTSLQDRMNTAPANSIYILGMPSNISSFLDRHPHYFDLD